MLCKRTRYAVAVAGTIERTLKRLEKERAAPKFRQKVRKRHGEVVSREAVPLLDQTPFWEASVVLLERHFVVVTTLVEPEDLRIDRYVEMGPWNTMVALAQQATGLTHYADAILGHAEHIRLVDAAAPPQNVVAFRRA